MRWKRRCENKREVVWKTNRKEDETCGKEDEIKVNKEGCENNDKKIDKIVLRLIIKQDKKNEKNYERKLMATNY